MRQQAYTALLPSLSQLSLSQITPAAVRAPEANRPRVDEAAAATGRPLILTIAEDVQLAIVRELFDGSDTVNICKTVTRLFANVSTEVTKMAVALEGLYRATLARLLTVRQWSSENTPLPKGFES